MLLLLLMRLMCVAKYTEKNVAWGGGAQSPPKLMLYLWQAEEPHKSWGHRLRSTDDSIIRMSNVRVAFWLLFVQHSLPAPRSSTSLSLSYCLAFSSRLMSTTNWAKPTKTSLQQQREGGEGGFGGCNNNSNNITWSLDTFSYRPIVLFTVAEQTKCHFS